VRLNDVEGVDREGMFQGMFTWMDHPVNAVDAPVVFRQADSAHIPRGPGAPSTAFSSGKEGRYLIETEEAYEILDTVLV